MIGEDEELELDDTMKAQLYQVMRQRMSYHIQSNLQGIRHSSLSESLLDAHEQTAAEVRSILLEYAPENARLRQLLGLSNAELIPERYPEFVRVVNQIRVLTEQSLLDMPETYTTDTRLRNARAKLQVAMQQVDLGNRMRASIGLDHGFEQVMSREGLKLERTYAQM